MSLSDIYHGVTEVKIGDGSMSLVWKDLWLDQTLELSHPRAFSHTKLEDASTATLLAMTDIQNGFHLPLSQQAREEVRDLQNRTALTMPDVDTKDERACC